MTESVEVCTLRAVLAMVKRLDETEGERDAYLWGYGTMEVRDELEKMIRQAERGLTP